jgi:hypothetical protein
MSIDAQVKTVIINEDGSGELLLVDRPRSRPGDYPGIAGQRSLEFSTAPEEVTALNGRNVWGGASSLMLGDEEIAERTGICKIRFHDADTLRRALQNYPK